MFPEDCDLLRSAIEEAGARLVIVDPLLAFLGVGAYGMNDHSVRRALSPLAQIAQDTGAAILLVRHLTKGGTGRQAVYRGSGSMAIIGSARSAFLVARDAEDPDLRLFACTKNNLAPAPPTLSFRIVSGARDQPVVNWAGPVDVTADELARASVRPADALSHAVTFLEDLLSSGPASATSASRQARALGISDRTLYRAKAQLRIVSEQSHDDGHKTWLWSLPPPDNDEAATAAEHRRFIEKFTTATQ